LDETDAQQQPYWPELEEVARPARERRRLPPEVRSEIIVRLCRRAPLSVKDLSVLLDRSEAYVGDAIRPLVMSGGLTFLYPDQPRHPRQKYIAGAEPVSSPPTPVSSSPLAPDAGPRVPEPVFRAAVPVPTPRRFPNQATNLVYVFLVGLILGLMAIEWWWALAIAAAVSLSCLHLATDSVQYRAFTSLRFLGSKKAGFLVLKSAVALAEIVVIYILVRAVIGPNT
jgi:hypothetical protein